MSVTLSPPMYLQFFSAAGVPALGYQLFTYIAGTSTKQATWTDSTQTSQNSNPIVLDSQGAAYVWLDPTLTYKFVLALPTDTDPPGSAIRSVDDIQGAVTLSVLQTGIGVYYLRTAAEIAESVIPTNYGYAPGVAERFGAVGDGVTDNTVALTNWAKCATNGLGMHLNPGGVYVFDPSAGTHGIVFSASQFSVYGNGATIIAKAAAASNAACEMLYLTGCTDFAFYDLVVDANRANRTPTATNSATTIRITTSCARGKFSKVRSINAVIDGWYVDTGTEGTQSTYPTDIVLEDCEGYNAYRNNLSLIGSLRFSVRGGRFHGATGTSPQRGIDIEPNSTTTYANQDLLLDGADLSDNSGYGLSIGVSSGSGYNQRVRSVNLSGQNNAAGFAQITAVKDFKASNWFISNHSAATRGQIDIGANTATADVELDGIHFDNITGGSELIYIHSSVTDVTKLSDIKVATSSIPILSANAQVTCSDIDAQNITAASPAISNTAARSAFSNLHLRTITERGFYNTGADVTLKKSRFRDCGSTTASVHFDTGSTDPIVENCDVYQSSSIPSGAVGFYFRTIPKVALGLTAKSAGTDYTSANVMTLFAGAVGGLVRECIPPAADQAVASAATVTLPRCGRVVSITGTTGITSITATGMDGEIMTLVFTGILTVTNGSNLKLTGNFTTAAGSALTVACDGTNWYEVGRKS